MQNEQQKINELPVAYAINALHTYISQQRSKVMLRYQNGQISEKALAFISAQQEELQAIAERLQTECTRLQQQVRNANIIARMRNDYIEYLQDISFTRLPEKIVKAATKMEHKTALDVKKAVIRAYTQIETTAI